MAGKTKSGTNRRPIKGYAKHELSWYIVGFFIALLLVLSYVDKKNIIEVNHLIVFFIIFMISVYIIMKSTGFAIESISHYAKLTGISDFVIGFIVVAIATSLPEMSTAYFASSSGNGSLSLGDLIGGNIITITLVLGITVWIAKKIKVKKGIIGKTLFEEIAILMLPVILGIDGTFSKADGIILVLGFILYMIIITKEQGKFGALKKNIRIKHIWKDIIIFGGTIGAILLSTSILIRSLDVISYILNIPEIIVGCLFLGIATTVPELTIGIKSALKGLQDISMGNVFGSMIINFSLVLGFAALINPIKIMDKPMLILSQGLSAADSFSYISFIIGSLIFLSAIFAVSRFIKTGTLTKKHGKIMILIAIIFFIVQIALAILKNAT